MTGRSPGTPVVQALAECYGVQLDQLKGTGTGGRITKADVLAAAGITSATGTRAPAPQSDGEAAYASAWGNSGSSVQLASSASGPPATDLRFSRNPLADELRRDLPGLYQSALAAGGAPPALFGTADLPPATASGLQVSLLMNVPWTARPALALLGTAAALSAYARWSADSTLAEMEGPRTAPDGGDLVADYRSRFAMWVEGGHARQNDAAEARQRAAEASAVTARAKADEKAKAAMNAAAARVWS